MPTTTSSRDNFVEFSQTPYRDYFRGNHYKTLKQSLQDFLKCRVSVVYAPIERFKTLYDVDVLADSHRSVRVVSENLMLVTVHPEFKPGLYASFGLVISDPQIALPKESFARSIAFTLKDRLSFAFPSDFDINLQFFGNYFILDIIVNFVCHGGYKKNTLKFLFEMFANLRTLTFENRLFNTGLILTRSHRTYSARKLAGSFMKLKDIYALGPHSQEDKRFWYLADGSSCFYVCDRNLNICNMFFLDQDSRGFSYTSPFFLEKILLDRDIAFRTIQGKEMVAITTDGEEFTFNGLKWHFRDYSLIHLALKKLLPDFQQLSLNSLMLLVITKMFNRRSALVWIPWDKAHIDNLTLRSSQLWDYDMSVSDSRFRGLILRLASSDGALIMSKDGYILRFGAVANMTDACARDVAISGAGSIAAQFLSQSGVVIKVSADGVVKVYTNGELCWIL